MEKETTKKIAPYLIFLAAMLWATDAPFRLYLTEGFSSNFIVLAEHTVDVLFILPILYFGFRELKKLKIKEWLSVLIIAIGGSALASIAFTQAFHYVNPSVAILLQKLQPLIAIALATSLLKEKLSKKFWLWAILALLGAYLISFSGFIPQLFPGEKFNPNLTGVLLALLAAILWGASTVLGKVVLNKINFKLMTALRFFVAWIFLLALNIVEHSLPKFSQITGKDYLFIFIIAIASGVISLFIYYLGLGHTKASIATLAELGFPMAAVIINWIFIPQGSLTFVQILGIIILLFAIFKLSRENSNVEFV